MKTRWLSKSAFISIPFFLVLPGCVAPPPKPETIPPLRKEPVPFKISDVSIDRKVFDPAKGEEVTIYYRISRPAKSIIKVFDSEMRLVRELFLESPSELEPSHVAWDGKDMDGRTVPDEAYFLTIESSDFHGNFTFYDPTVISGGEASVPEVILDREKGLISYRLAQDSRVKIRVGIPRGPMLRNILNWVPRLSGEHEETWDGKDASGVIDVLSQKDYLLDGEAVGLPENSIITRGNTAYDYFTYKSKIAPDRPEKVERPRFQDETAALGLPPMVPTKLGPEPTFRMDLPKITKTTDSGLPVVAGKTPIKIFLDESVKRFVTEERYEIVFFVDFEFVTEMEEGYSPVTFFWDTRDINNGEHVITVNVVTLTGRLSSSSIKAVVEN